MDIRLVADTARVGFVFNKIGITPEACSSWFLPRIVNMGTALEWIYSGDLISAEELTRKGFANQQLDGASLLDKAYEMAARISSHSQVAVALTRQMMYRNAALPHPIGAHEVDSLAIFYASQTSGKEGVSAFLESERRILMTMPLPTCRLSTPGGKPAQPTASTSTVSCCIASCLWLGLQIGCISQNYGYNGASL